MELVCRVGVEGGSVPALRLDRPAGGVRQLAEVEGGEGVRRRAGSGGLEGAIALVGGLVIGVVEALSGFYLPEGFKDIAPYVVVLIMLVVRPNGLFGEKLRKKV